MLDELQLRSDALDLIARFYADLPRLRDVVGAASLTPEKVIDRLLDATCWEKTPGSFRFCDGNGEPHFWPDAEHKSHFERRCSEHPERRSHERRRSMREKGDSTR